MRRIWITALSVIVSVQLIGCGAPAVGVTNVSGQVVENFTTSLNIFLRSDLGTANAMVGGDHMLYSFPDRDIIRVEMDCTFTDVAQSETAGSDEHRKAVYDAVRNSATFTQGGETVEPIWGYWPESSKKNSAKRVVFFYLIPENEPLENLKLTIDGSALGDASYRLEFTDFSRE